MLHRTRHLFIRQQTSVINAIRAHMAEFGVVARVGRTGVVELLAVAVTMPTTAFDLTVRTGELHVRHVDTIGVIRAPRCSMRCRLSHLGEGEDAVDSPVLPDLRRRAWLGANWRLGFRRFCHLRSPWRRCHRPHSGRGVLLRNGRCFNGPHVPQPTEWTRRQGSPSSQSRGV
jgi:hypothetical protein